MQITPYMHIMVFHVPEMINAHGNIKQFSSQGMCVTITLTTDLYAHMWHIINILFRVGIQ